jgi:hypothetical protein
MHPQKLDTFIEAILRGIEHRHPAIGEFLDEALAAGLVSTPDDEGLRMIRRSLHHTYLLDELTRAMAADREFTNEVSEHLLGKREEVGIRRTFWASTFDVYKLTREIFGPAKTKTMDSVFHWYAKMRRLEPGVKGGLPLLKRRILMFMNITEAVLTDAVHGMGKNALAGVTLLTSPVRQICVRADGGFMEIHLSKGWPELYQTWNLAFMVGNLRNLDLLLPKLVMPCVMNAAPADYIFLRGLSLWTTINFQIFAFHAKRSHALPRQKDLARLWGEVNRRHARRFIRTERGVAATAPDYSNRAAVI